MKINDEIEKGLTAIDSVHYHVGRMPVNTKIDVKLLIQLTKLQTYSASLIRDITEILYKEHNALLLKASDREDREA